MAEKQSLPNVIAVKPNQRMLNAIKRESINELLDMIHDGSMNVKSGIPGSNYTTLCYAALGGHVCVCAFLCVFVRFVCLQS
jgi:hypothetical protein